MLRRRSCFERYVMIAIASLSSYSFAAGPQEGNVPHTHRDAAVGEDTRQFSSGIEPVHATLWVQQGGNGSDPRERGSNSQSDSVSAGSGTYSSRSSARRAATSKREDLEEVIVTAQKREERLQDVPVSIAVVTADDIALRGLVSAGDYLRAIPGVSQGENERGQGITIRGIASRTDAEYFSSGGTTVATYFGETPTASSSGLGGGGAIDIKLVDIARVEVLRGPQGTAFGDSSLGGAVRTIPQAPRLDLFEGKLSAGYSHTSGTGGENHNIDAVLNLPVVRDRFALRAVGYRYDDSGFYRNVSGSDADFQNAVAAYGEQALAFATNFDDVGATRYTGGRVAALYQPIEAFKLTLSYLKQKNELNGNNFSTSAGYDQLDLQIAPEHANAFRNQKLGANDNEISLANVLAEYDVGWGDVVGTYSDIDSGSNYMFAFTPLPFSAAGENPHREHIAEVRLSTRLEGAWNFLGGLYRQKTRDHGVFDYYWYGDPELNFFDPGVRYLGTLIDERRSLEQKAAFAEVSWTLLPRLTLTGGARKYHYDRSEKLVLGQVFGGTVEDESTRSSGTIYRANLSYKPTKDALLYAGWSQGFRLGRPALGLSSDLCDVDNDGVVDGSNGISIASTFRTESDSVDNYEIGGKFTLLDRRLFVTGAMFRVDWTGVPFPVVVTCPAVPDLLLNYFANAGSARSEGVEAQVSLSLTSALRVDIGGSYIRAKFTTDVPALMISDGYPLPAAPEVNANLGLQYQFTLGSYPTALRFDATYVDSFYSELLSDDLLAQGLEGAGNYVKMDASARLTVRSTNLDIFVNNLSNSDAFVYGGANPFGPGYAPFRGARLRPRTVGLRVSYDF